MPQKENYTIVFLERLGKMSSLNIHESVYLSRKGNATFSAFRVPSLNFIANVDFLVLHKGLFHKILLLHFII